MSNEQTKDDYILLLEKELAFYKAKCEGQADQIKELEEKIRALELHTGVSTPYPTQTTAPTQTVTQTGSPTQTFS